jgi:hypothetical protein
MKEMSEQDGQTGDAVRARRKRVIERVFGIIGLVASCFWLLVFIMVLRTGYLSWIGITVAAFFIASMIVAPVFTWAGRRRLATLCHGLHFGMMILPAVLVGVTFLWPQGNDGTWHSYRFDDELAAIEAKRAVPDAENAAPRYESVFGRMNMDDEPNFVFSGTSFIRSELGDGPWKGNDYPQATAWLDSQSSTIDGLLEIGKMEKCRWPVQADMFDEHMVPYKKLRRCMVLLIAAGNRDLGENRVTAALTKYFCTLRLADHIHQQPSEGDCFTSLGCERDGLRMIRYVLVQSPLSDEDLAQVASHLPSAADPRPEEWERLLEHEKLHYMNLLGRLYEVNADGAVRFATWPLISAKYEDGNHAGGFPSLYWLMSMPRNPHAVRSIADKYFAGLEHHLDFEPQPLMDKYQPPSRSSLDDFAKATCNAYRWGLEMCFFDRQEYVRHRQQRAPSITARRGTWLVLGLRRYRDAHGVWPQTLDAISEYTPAEAFLDPTAGEAFVYTLDGDSFRLYSKGSNRIDEGGRRRYVKALDKSEDDIAIWPPPRPEPQPSKEEIEKELEKIYGKDYWRYVK